VPLSVTGPQAAVIAATLAAAALAGPLEDATAAYGRGDYATAFRLSQPLTIGGTSVAQNNLGLIYAKGEGVRRDYVEAYKWFDLAVSRLRVSEKGKRDQVVKNRDVLAARMTPAQIAEAQKLAREWKPTK
jgi:TPR repeat protein